MSGIAFVFTRAIFFVLMNFKSVTNAYYIYTNKTIMAKEKKEHISGRVNEKAILNIEQIAICTSWSFNQTLEFAMEQLKVADVINCIKAKHEEQNKKQL